MGEPKTPRIELPVLDTPPPGPGRTPRETYEAARGCVARKDYLGAWALFSEEARAEADGNLPPTLGEWRHFRSREFEQTFGMSVDEFEKLPIAEQYALLSLCAHVRKPSAPRRFAESEFASESAEGSAAELVYRTPDGKERRMKLVREGELWYLARPRF